MKIEDLQKIKFIILFNIRYKATVTNIMFIYVRLSLVITPSFCRTSFAKPSISSGLGSVRKIA